MSVLPLQPDPIRPWFKVLKGMGEYIGIRFGQVDEVTGAVKWLDLPHSQYDGIGGFAKLLRSGGAEIELLPRIPHESSKSWGPFLRSLPSLLTSRRRVSVNTSAAARETETYNTPPTAVAWHVFNEEETTLIRRASRLLQISVNSLLLRHLDRAIRPNLEDPSVRLTWMVPVNLRGKVRTSEDTCNHSSYVAVSLTTSSTPIEVHKKIYSKLKKGEHWANWKSYHMGKFLSVGLKEKLIRNDRATSRWSIGGFSNLGIWDSHSEFQSEGCKGPWIFAPPVLECQRIGAGCVTFQNRLSLMIQAHPMLTTDSAVTAAWMREWIDQIKIDMAAPRIK